MLSPNSYNIGLITNGLVAVQAGLLYVFVHF